MLFFDPFARMTTERKRFNAELKKKLSEAQGGRCMYHGARVAIRLMEIDHKIPLSKGGSNKIQNLQALCRTCNLRKGDKTDRQFRRMYKPTGLPQTQILPTKPIPQRIFEEVGKVVASARKKRQAKVKDSNPFGV